MNGINPEILYLFFGVGIVFILITALKKPGAAKHKNNNVTLDMQEMYIRLGQLIDKYNTMTAQYSIAFDEIRKMAIEYKDMKIIKELSSASDRFAKICNQYTSIIDQMESYVKQNNVNDYYTYEKDIKDYIVDVFFICINKCCFGSFSNIRHFCNIGTNN